MPKGENPESPPTRSLGTTITLTWPLSFSMISKATSTNSCNTEIPCGWLTLLASMPTASYLCNEILWVAKARMGVESKCNGDALFLNTTMYALYPHYPQRRDQIAWVWCSFISELGCALLFSKPQGYQPMILPFARAFIVNLQEKPWETNLNNSSTIIMTHSFIGTNSFLRALCRPTHCTDRILVTFCRFHLSCVSLRAHLHFLHPEDVGQWRHGWTSLAIACLRRWWTTSNWHWFLWLMTSNKLFLIVALNPDNIIQQVLFLKFLHAKYC